MTSPLPDDALGETFYATPEELLCQMRLERAKIPKCVKALPRLKGRDWRLTKLVWTFAPSGMQGPGVRACDPRTDTGLATRLWGDCGRVACPTGW